MAKPSESTNEIQNELEEKWLTIYDQAQYCKGVAETGNHIVPDWYDHDKFSEAQKFIKKDFIA